MNKEDFEKLGDYDALFTCAVSESEQIKLCQAFKKYILKFYAKNWHLTKEEAYKAFILEQEKEIKKAKGYIKQAQDLLIKENPHANEVDATIKEDTQQYRILEYIKENGSITPLDAYNDLGITKLATRISEMRAKGFTFKQKRESGKNRYDEDVNYMRYFLEG